MPLFFFFFLLALTELDLEVDFARVLVVFDFPDLDFTSFNLWPITFFPGLASDLLFDFFELLDLIALPLGLIAPESDTEKEKPVFFEVPAMYRVK